MAEGVGLLERHDAEAEAFREVRAPRGEKKIHLRSRKRFAQGEAERDGEERVSHPVVGADDEDAPQCFGAGKTPLHPDRAAGDAFGAGPYSRKVTVRRGYKVRQDVFEVAP